MPDDSDGGRRREAIQARLRRTARRLASVRARTTLIATAAVAVALVLGSIGLVGLLRASLTEGLENTLTAQAADVAALLSVGPLPAELPDGHTDTFTQVVGPAGAVLASSANLQGHTAVSNAHPGEDGIVVHHVPGLIGGGDADGDLRGPFLLLAKTATATAPGTRGTEIVIVYVGASLHTVEQGTNPVTLALLAGVPILVALVGALVWVIGGRALRPVEAIRAEVADITGQGLHRRVPEPPSNDEVGRLARTMNEMLDRLQSSATAQRRFVADASHELRSPLAALQATLEVALTHPDAAAWPSVSAEALDEVSQLHRLVEDLLFLARSEDPSAGARDQTVDLDEVVLREGHRWPPGHIGVDLHRVSGGRVRGDAVELARVVRNLLDNAQRHASSQVVLELHSNDQTVELVVSDDGPGVDRADRQRIFERFARLDESRNQDDGGTGLGLAIAHEIILAHGGTISVIDSDQGARFAVRLPAYDATGQER